MSDYFEIRDDFYLNGEKIKIISGVSTISASRRNTGVTGWKS